MNEAVSKYLEHLTLAGRTTDAALVVTFCNWFVGQPENITRYHLMGDLMNLAIDACGFREIAQVSLDVFAVG